MSENIYHTLGMFINTCLYKNAYMELLLRKKGRTVNRLHVYYQVYYHVWKLKWIQRSLRILYPHWYTVVVLIVLRLGV